MFQFLVKRFFAAVVLVLFVTFITFAVMKINFTLPEINFTAKLPFTNITIIEIHSDETLIQTGDPLADLKLNPTISEERIAAEAKRLGLDKSFIEQYFSWLTNVLKGNFGLSQSNQRVVDLIKPALLNTLVLNVLAIFFTWMIAGGIFYSVGTLFLKFGDKVNYFHALWHTFVIAGSISHYIAILLIIVLK